MKRIDKGDHKLFKHVIIVLLLRLLYGGIFSEDYQFLKDFQEKKENNRQVGSLQIILITHLFHIH